MTVYRCDVCGMSPGSMTCGTCDRELEHGGITSDAGDKFWISKGPQDHGMIGSPTCCGRDMTPTA